MIRALALVLFATSMFAQSERGALYVADRKAVADANSKQDSKAARDALAKMHSDFPENSRIVRNLAYSENSLDHRNEAAELLRLYAAMGGTLDFAGAPWSALRDLAGEAPSLARNDAAVTHGARVFQLKDPDLLVEDVTYEPDSKRFFLSSIHQHKILSCDVAGECEDFMQTADPVFAVHMDAPRHVLWASTADMDAGKTSLIEFDLQTRKRIKHLEPADPGKHTIGDLTIGGDGAVYASDGLSGDVFLVPMDGNRLEKLVPPGTFFSPQTPALSADGKTLFVPDYAAGVAAIRLSDHHVEWLKSTIPAALEGIDGLYDVNGRWIAVQNGIQPQRVVEFHLDAGRAVDKVSVLEANWKGLGQPTHGVQVGREFFFIVNSGWERMSDSGVFKPGEPAELWKLPL